MALNISCFKPSEDFLMSRSLSQPSKNDFFANTFHLVCLKQKFVLFFRKWRLLLKNFFFSEFVIFLLFWRKDLFNAFCWFFSVVWHRKRATVNSFANADFFLFRLFFFSIPWPKEKLTFFSSPVFSRDFDTDVGDF